MNIDENLAHSLIISQFPQWQNLPIKMVMPSGWDNRTFHLGDNMLIRLPSGDAYAAQVDKEQQWLPILAPQLPLTIPHPLAKGKPSQTYPWPWSVYQWIPGTIAAVATIENLSTFAETLGTFLVALQKIKTENAPIAGEHNFYRGGPLSVYDAETKHAITVLDKKINPSKALAIWEEAVATHWTKPPVWIHGDISPENLLLTNGKLSAVIDFGLMAIGDPACDLAIPWTFFNKNSREIFKNIINVDSNTWNRGQAWALWKALITATNNNSPTHPCWQTLTNIL